MSQSAVDSPAQNPNADASIATAAPISSADDLLAQLAGEEIDRLLAEGDADSGAAAAKSASVDEPVVSAMESAHLNEVLTPAQAAPNKSPVDDVAVANVAVPVSPTPEFAPAVAEAADLNSATAAAEMKQLLDEKVIPDESDDPIYVRCLEVLNAPIASMSDSLRELIGKLAILTLFNSVAVLLYVLIFRKH